MLVCLVPGVAGASHLAVLGLGWLSHCHQVHNPPGRRCETLDSQWWSVRHLSQKARRGSLVSKLHHIYGIGKDVRAVDATEQLTEMKRKKIKSSESSEG